MPEDAFENRIENTLGQSELTSINRMETDERLEEVGEDGTYFTSYRPRHEDVGLEIVLALEEITGRDTTDLPKLADYIDPEALDRLFDPCREKGSQGGSVHFTIEKYVVSIHSDGKILITSRDGEE